VARRVLTPRAREALQRGRLTAIVDAQRRAARTRAVVLELLEADLAAKRPERGRAARVLKALPWRHKRPRRTIYRLVAECLELLRGTTSSRYSLRANTENGMKSLVSVLADEPIMIFGRVGRLPPGTVIVLPSAQRAKQPKSDRRPKKGKRDVR
jgi:hypothetical protein